MARFSHRSAVGTCLKRTCTIPIKFGQAPLEDMSLRNALKIATATSPGLIRAFNEDSIITEPDIGLLILADGMGGYKAGDIASTMATTIIREQLLAALKNRNKASDLQLECNAVRTAVAVANQAIHDAAQRANQFHGMGTTLVLALFINGRVVLAHVGDSRIYRYRHGKLEQLTVDHSLLQEQVDMGLITAEDAKVSHNRNLVTRALGVAAEVALDVRVEGTEEGDIYLLCSDGLNDMVADDDIGLALKLLNVNLPLTAEQLLLMANDNGGHDNVSVAIAKVVSPEQKAEGGFALWLQRLLNLVKGRRHGEVSA